MTSRDFDSEAEEFEASLGQPWNRIKYDLALANIVEWTSGRDTPAEILDVGAGTGELALRFAERGHEVTLLDASPSMLAIAERKARERHVSSQCRFVRGAVEDLDALLDRDRYALVLCHNTLEYLEDPEAEITRMAEVVEVGGCLSLLVMNSAALPLQRLWVMKEPRLAIEQLGRNSYVNRFGVTAHAWEPDRLVKRLAGAGLRVDAWYGVRMFFDFLADSEKGEGEKYECLYELERRARAMEPYRRIGRDIHVLASRP